MRWNTCLAVAVITASAQFGLAQQTVPDSTVKTAEQPAELSSELAAIQKQAEAFVDAFNKHDAKAVAEFWTRDGEYIDDAGQVYEGRKAIEAFYARLFAVSPESKIQILTDALRLLSGGAAIEDGRALVEPAPMGASGISSYTAVHVNVDGKWLMASVRDIWSDSSGGMTEVADLEFLIGVWTAEENGIRTESNCTWICNKRFVERKYTATQLDGTTSSGLQIIGWNPQVGGIQSWDFNSAGGHAVGAWVATDGGWLAKITGITAEGVTTTSVNVLRRLDDDAYVWQSMDRVFGDIGLPDTKEVIIRRKPVAQ